MPRLNAKLTGYVEGDTLSVRRTIDRAKSGLASGVTLVNAWLTVKAAIADADPGLVQKAITTTDVPGTGQIENDGTGDVDPVLRFDLGTADTGAIGTTERFYDIQLKTNGGAIYTPEKGVTVAEAEVTKAT